MEGTDEDLPAVSIVIPVLDEEEMLKGCLEAVAAQTYPRLLEVIVADGGSVDRTRDVAKEFADVRVVDNPRRSRPAGLNVAIGEVAGDVIVRVDARTRISPDYVARSVDALERTGAAIVGGPMRYQADGPQERGIAAALSSRLGAGPAEFRRTGGAPRFVDTVYLGAFRAATIASLGGYDERSGGNEDAELAFRAQSAGGVYLDPAIESHYVVRDGFGALARQFYRYGLRRAGTVRKHPRSLSPRQLAVPLLFLGLLSPWRKVVLLDYALLVVGRAGLEARRDLAAAPVLLVALPTMHGAWGVGFVRGVLGWRSAPLSAGGSRDVANGDGTAGIGAR